MNTISLHYNQTTAELSPKGAQLISFRTDDQREMIWQGAAEIWDQHAPVLFPVCGRVRNGHIKIRDKTYPMQMHGFAHTSDFSIGTKGDDHVEFVLCSNETSKKMYPFDFMLHIIYQLKDRGWTTRFIIKNLSSDPMPVCLGGHPGFICPMEKNSVFNDYCIIFPLKEKQAVLSVLQNGLVGEAEPFAELASGRVISLDHAYFDKKDTLIFSGINSRHVFLIHKTTGHGICLSFPFMETLSVWTRPWMHADYICLEPWHGLPGRESDGDSFEEKPFITMIGPNETYSTWFTAGCI